MTINNANWASIIKSWRCALYATPVAGEVSVSKCVREQKPRNVAARSTSRASSAVARLFHSPLRSVTSISRTLFRTSIRLTERFHAHLVSGTVSSFVRLASARSPHSLPPIAAITAASPDCAYVITPYFPLFDPFHSSSLAIVISRRSMGL